MSPLFRCPFCTLVWNASCQPPHRSSWRVVGSVAIEPRHQTGWSGSTSEEGLAWPTGTVAQLNACAGTAANGAGALWTAYLLSGRPGPLRALAAGAAFLIVYWTVFDVERIVTTVTDDPLAGAMGAPLMGPGPLVAAVGGVVLLGATFSVPALAGGMRRTQWMRVLLAAALLAAGAVHLQQAPEHLEVST